MAYTDGFVLPILKDNVEAYRQIAQAAGEVWRDHGALDYKECVLDDPDVEVGVSFLDAFDLDADETMVLAWIVYESREERDRINAAVMDDPRIKDIDEEMPFDVARMTYGGFEVLVDPFAD